MGCSDYSNLNYDGKIDSEELLNIYWDSIIGKIRSKIELDLTEDDFKMNYDFFVMCEHFGGNIDELVWYLTDKGYTDIAVLSENQMYMFMKENQKLFGNGYYSFTEFFGFFILAVKKEEQKVLSVKKSVRSAVDILFDDKQVKKADEIEVKMTHHYWYDILYPLCKANDIEIENDAFKENYKFFKICETMTGSLNGIKKELESRGYQIIGLKSEAEFVSFLKTNMRGLDSNLFNFTMIDGTYIVATKNKFYKTIGKRDYIKLRMNITGNA